MSLRDFILAAILGAALAPLGCSAERYDVGATPDATASSSGGGASVPPCAPGPLCDAHHECIALEDYSDATAYNLRMSELRFTNPPALTTDLVKLIVSNGVRPNIPECNLSGAATVVWLLQFDEVAKTLTTGIAKPGAEEAEGYKLLEQTFVQGSESFAVHPVTFPGVSVASDGRFDVVDGKDIVVPVFLDAAATKVILLPLHSMRIFDGRISADRNCIGHYNAEGLDPSSGCLGDAAHPTFVTGAVMSGYVSLEEADKIVAVGLDRTLCALLSGEGDGGEPINKCKRTNGQIDALGDWCIATNAPATAGCADAYLLKAEFAASAVRIDN